MTIDQLKSEIGKIGLADRLLLVEDVWDSIADENESLPMPEWHRRELDR
ncbi:MAG: addiction module protein [Candidatus Hydrogenedentes bacterium]|nr:addiction module protein [Candidatus Hydrogenedentota bacterium]